VAVAAGARLRRKPRTACGRRWGRWSPTPATKYIKRRVALDWLRVVW
jgi:hypothetical protein